MMEEGTASPEDLNMYAWYSLFKKGGVDKVSLEVGERGNQISKDHFPIMHTLACQYADIGRGKDAYNLIIRAMDVASFTEPNTEIWYTLGRIAESYGETDAALAMYKRVEPNDEGLYHPVDTIILARRHMEPIVAAQKTPSSASTQTGSK
jgi:hypothetical protein